jgi:uncharacterized protein YceK
MNATVLRATATKSPHPTIRRRHGCARRFAQLFIIALLASVALCEEGCASIVSRGFARDPLGFPVYCGPAVDLGVLVSVNAVLFSGDGWPWYMPLLSFPVIVDLPLSFVADTLWLPIDITSGVMGKRRWIAFPRSVGASNDRCSFAYIDCGWQSFCSPEGPRMSRFFAPR